MDTSMTREEQEYAVIANQIDSLCVLCACTREAVVDRLTGLLWDEEEARGIKDSTGKYFIRSLYPPHAPIET